MVNEQGLESLHGMFCEPAPRADTVVIKSGVYTGAAWSARNVNILGGELGNVQNFPSFGIATHADSVLILGGRFRERVAESAHHVEIYWGLFAGDVGSRSSTVQYHGGIYQHLPLPLDTKKRVCTGHRVYVDASELVE